MCMDNHTQWFWQVSKNTLKTLHNWILFFSYRVTDHPTTSIGTFNPIFAIHNPVSPFTASSLLLLTIQWMFSCSLRKTGVSLHYWPVKKHRKWKKYSEWDNTWQHLDAQTCPAVVTGQSLEQSSSEYLPRNSGLFSPPSSRHSVPQSYDRGLYTLRCKLLCQSPEHFRNVAAAVHFRSEMFQSLNLYHCRRTTWFQACADACNFMQCFSHSLRWRTITVQSADGRQHNQNHIQFSSTAF